MMADEGDVLKITAGDGDDEGQNYGTSFFLFSRWSSTCGCIVIFISQALNGRLEKYTKNRNMWNEVYFHILQHYEKKWQLMRDQIVMECTIATL